MDISLTHAKAQLTELVRRAEAGEEIVLTRHGQPTVRLAPVVTQADREKKLALIESLRGSVPRGDGPSAARSQDFLYDEYGLPA